MSIIIKVINGIETEWICEDGKEEMYFKFNPDKYKPLNKEIKKEEIKLDEDKIQEIISKGFSREHAIKILSE